MRKFKFLFVFLSVSSIFFAEEDENFITNDEYMPEDEIALYDAHLQQKQEQPIAIKNETIETAVPSKRRDHFTYVRLGPGNSDLSKELLPSIAVGRRYEIQSAAIDLSTGFAFLGKDTITKAPNYYYYLPKIQYLRYTQQTNENTLFYGTGLSFFGMKIKHDNSTNAFYGIAGHLSVGYELGRNERIRQMIQFDMSQPLLAATRSGSFPLPTIEISAGVGF